MGRATPVATFPVVLEHNDADGAVGGVVQLRPHRLARLGVRPDGLAGHQHLLDELGAAQHEVVAHQRPPFHRLRNHRHQVVVGRVVHEEEFGQGEAHAA